MMCKMYMYEWQRTTSNSSPYPFSPPRDLVTARITWILSELVSLNCLPRVSASQQRSVLLTKMQHCTCGNDGRPQARLCKPGWDPSWDPVASPSLSVLNTDCPEQTTGLKTFKSSFSPKLLRFYANFSRTSWRCFSDHSWVKTCSTTTGYQF